MHIPSYPHNIGHDIILQEHVCYSSDVVSTLSVKSASSSASFLKSSILSGLIIGRSFVDDTPKHLRNSSVVPNMIGRPGASSLPTSCTRLYSMSLFMACTHETPLIASISGLVIGCLYAIIDKVSRTTSVRESFFGVLTTLARIP